MPDPKEPRWNMNVASLYVAACALLTCGAFVWSKADKTEVQLKADKKDLDGLALTVSTLASKKEVEGLVSAVASLTEKLTEFSARQREGAVTLDYIKTIAEKTDARLVKIQDDQKWQIKQEVDRLQWQSFKPDPPDPANVKR
jgi:hypothetical protein